MIYIYDSTACNESTAGYNDNTLTIGEIIANILNFIAHRRKDLHRNVGHSEKLYQIHNSLPRNSYTISTCVCKCV